jgi:DNA-binding IscR family transcriptional regulator
MSRDSKLSSILHLLLHIGEAPAPLTSEALAGMMQTNPVVIRRLLGGLREHGLVSSEKGHGGGWVLNRDLAAISVADVYSALGAPALIQFHHRNEKPTCLLEKAVNSALDEAREDAEALLLKSLEALPLGKLADQVRHHHATAKHGRKGSHAL